MAAFTAAQLFDVKFIPDAEMDAAINTMASRFTRTMVCHPGHVKPEEGGAGGYSRVGTNFYPDSFKDPRPAMRKVLAPVLVLHGECDFLAYSDVYEYVAQFPQASYRFVPRAGHIIWWDRPDAYLGAVKEFLNADAITLSRSPMADSKPQSKT
jgi:pimeloyl-ACP methyl ester carboxylesterase